MAAADVIIGQIKLKGFIEDTCFTSIKDFIARLPDWLIAEIPSEATNVVVGTQQPSSDQTNAVWFRQDNSGTFIGVYVYSNGTWKQIVPAPNGIIRMYGDSRAVPDGYQLIDNSNSNFTAAEVTAIQATWIKDVTNTYWRVFDVTFQGL
jgi:hypothetical protein